MHSLDKIKPKLAEISSPLRPLLNFNINFTWTLACDDIFEQLKQLVKNVVELKNFSIYRETRIDCDACYDGLEAVLEQYGSEGGAQYHFL